MKNSDIAALFSIVVLAMILGFIIGTGFQEAKFETKAIKAGVGYYNPTNATFQFIPIQVNYNVSLQPQK